MYQKIKTMTTEQLKSNKIKNDVLKDFIETAKWQLVKRYGDCKISYKYNFIAFEHNRKDGFVEVGYSYTFFGDARTTKNRYCIPISVWDEDFLYVSQYIKEYGMQNIHFCLDTGNFIYRNLVELSKEEFDAIFKKSPFIEKLPVEEFNINDFKEGKCVADLECISYSDFAYFIRTVFPDITHEKIKNLLMYKYIYINKEDGGIILTNYRDKIWLPIQSIYKFFPLK